MMAALRMGSSAQLQIRPAEWGVSNHPRRDFMKLRLAVACSLLLSAFGPAAFAAGPHWDYRGAHGPAHWGQLDAAAETCARGAQQSPIDIRNAVVAALPVLQFSYGSVPPSIVNNGHTVQVNLPAGNALTLDGHR